MPGMSELAKVAGRKQWWRLEDTLNRGQRVRQTV